MKKRTIFIFGDSHTRALLRSFQRSEYTSHPLLTFDIHWLISEKRVQQGVSVGDMTGKEAIEIAKTLDADDLVVMTVLGGAHNRVALLKSRPPFTLASALENEHHDGILIPEAAMYDLLSDFIGGSGIIKKVASETPARLYHLAAPPPKGDTNYVLDRARRSLGEIDINPPRVRGRMWQLEMRAVQDLCRVYGIDFVPVPAGATTDDGLFLRPEYYAADVTHANPAYGLLVLKQLEQLALNGPTA